MASPITCHVLNTLSGTPASNLPTVLTLLAPTKPSSDAPAAPQPAMSFHAMTNDDGRVKEWQPSSDGQTIQSIMEAFSQGQRIPFSIKFDIGPWYEGQGIESFWPDVEVKFYVKKGERHYHVPVLVGPWTYTTYRGS